MEGCVQDLKGDYKESRKPYVRQSSGDYAANIEIMTLLPK